MFSFISACIDNFSVFCTYSYGVVVGGNLVSDDIGLWGVAFYTWNFILIHVSDHVGALAMNCTQTVIKTKGVTTIHLWYLAMCNMFIILHKKTSIFVAVSLLDVNNLASHYKIE